MDYRLIVLTHGDSAPLAETVDSFLEHVRPRPLDAYVQCDGGGSTPVAYDIALGMPCPTTLGGQTWPEGFCAATREAWAEGAAHAGSEGHEYVFWLEHDFRFLRDVDLRELAIPLVSASEGPLAQMALVRTACSPEELVAGGVVESRPGEFTPRAGWAGEGGDGGWAERAWPQHRSYFTTTPSLMRRDFMIENPWPAHEAECEGKFGLELVERGYSFGAWGSGEPWVVHVGERTGFGY